MNKMQYIIRDFEDGDINTVNQISLSAFNQYKYDFNDWAKLSSTVSNMASLSNQAELIVSVLNNILVGAVAYVKKTVI